MKKKNREFNIFSLSALDLFCSAMGVFMILCFVVFPYYKKEEPVKEEPPPAAEPEPTPTPTPKPEPTVQVIPNATVILHWESERQQFTPDGDGAPLGKKCWESILHNDVDLKVIADLNGERITYTHDDNGRPPAKVVSDGVKGGADIWVHPRIEPGTYEIYYRISNKDSKADAYYVNKHDRTNRKGTRYKISRHRVGMLLMTPDGNRGADPAEQDSTDGFHVYAETEFRPGQFTHLADIVVDANGAIRIRHYDRQQSPL